jgi:hypothetical protein
MVDPQSEQATKKCAGPHVGLIGDFVAHHEGVNDAGTGVGNGGRGVEVSSVGDRWLYAQDIMRCTRPHVALQKH